MIHHRPDWVRKRFPDFPLDPLSWASSDLDLTCQQIEEGEGNREFARWLADFLAKPLGPHCSPKTALHRYRLPKRNWDHDSFPPDGEVLLCSLWNAAQMYRWKGDDLAMAHAKLAPVAQAAQAAYGAGIPLDLAVIAQSIFKWGSVAGGTHRNSAWVASNASQTLRSCAAVHAMHLEKRFSAWMFSTQSVRMNSGFTKLYSLIFDKFIMYDSRVAAALAFLVMRYEAATGRTPAIKNDLRVFSGRAGHRTPKGFPRKTTELSHARANFAANWLVETLFSRKPSIVAVWDSHIASRTGACYRAFEAALFMLGYDIGGCAQQPASSKRTAW